MTRTFPRDIARLDDIFRFLAASLEAQGIAPDPDLTFWVNLIVEELFTNLVKYGTDGVHDIEIGIASEDDRLVIHVTDFDIEGFDVTQAPEVDTAQPLSERKIGGLGLHLVREIADNVSYEYANRNSTITVTKRLESKRA